MPDAWSGVAVTNKDDSKMVNVSGCSDTHDCECLMTVNAAIFAKRVTLFPIGILNVRRKATQEGLLMQRV